MKNTSVFLKINQELYCNTLQKNSVIVGGKILSTSKMKNISCATKYWSSLAGKKITHNLTKTWANDLKSLHYTEKNIPDPTPVLYLPKL